jgi:hypothetical protein
MLKYNMKTSGQLGVSASTEMEENRKYKSEAVYVILILVIIAIDINQELSSKSEKVGRLMSWRIMARSDNK